MGFWGFWWEAVTRAVVHALEFAHGSTFLMVVGAGLLSFLWRRVGQHLPAVESVIGSGRMAASVFGVIFLLSLAYVPYEMWQEGGAYRQGSSKRIAGTARPDRGAPSSYTNGAW